MYKLLICFVTFGYASAGYLNIAQQNSGNSQGINPNNNNNNNQALNSNYAYQHQVPLTLTSGPIQKSSQQSSQQSSQSTINPHHGPISSTTSQQISSYGSGQAATSSTYRQQHVNSHPATITTHGVATSYIAVPTPHGYYPNQAGGNGISNQQTPLGPNSSGSGISGLGGSSGINSYGGYGYTFSSSSGIPNGNQGNNGAGYVYSYGPSNSNQNQNQNNAGISG